jgi:hypothetical protein
MTDDPDGLRQLVAFAMQNAEKLFKKHGEVRAMWHAVQEDGEHFVVPPPGGRDKDEDVMMISALFELLNVKAYVFLDEAWMLARPTREQIAAADRDGLQHNPDRIEILLVSGEDENETVMCFREIIRGAGKATLGPLQYLDGANYLGGRMVGLLSYRRKGRVN